MKVEGVPHDVLMDLVVLDELREAPIDVAFAESIGRLFKDIFCGVFRMYHRNFETGFFEPAASQDCMVLRLYIDRDAIGVVSSWEQQKSPL